MVPASQQAQRRLFERKQHFRQMSTFADKLNLISQEEYDQLPLAPWFDVQGRVIPNQAHLPPFLMKVTETPLQVSLRKARQKLLLLCETRKHGKKRKSSASSLTSTPLPSLRTHDDCYPDYPEGWIDISKEC